MPLALLLVSFLSSRDYGRFDSLSAGSTGGGLFGGASTPTPATGATPSAFAVPAGTSLFGNPPPKPAGSGGCTSLSLLSTYDSTV